MPRNTRKLRPILALMFGGLLLTASDFGVSAPAAAFGRMGGFGGPAPGMRAGGGARAHMMVPRQGAGRNFDRSSSGGRGNVADGRGPGHHPIVGNGGGPPRGGGGTISVHVPVVGGGGSGGGASGGGSGGAGGGGGNNAGNGVPPRGERRFVPDEVITAFSPSATPQAIEQIARRYNLTQLEQQSFPLTGGSFYRWRIGGRRSMGDVVGALEDERIVTSAQPNYIFTLQDQLTQSAAGRRGDVAQYVLGKLQTEQAHQIATGKNILIALIDSEVDAKHPDLDGTVVKSFDALGGEEKPHQHGTAMAGAIAAHGKLSGIAQGPELLAARAFGDSAGAATGTSFAIYKSLQWAADNSARIVNMSFAGPADPDFHRLLAAAYDKGMVLIAAAGNAGPNSAPLYPAADPDVIAVTATDSNDNLFNMANRAPYIHVAAPGVEILALAPDDSYQITTGTSVAAAHVSGIAALLLERKPSLKPEEIRAIMTTTGKPLGSGGGRADAGTALVNAYRAVLSLNGAPVGQDEQAKQ